MTRPPLDPAAPHRILLVRTSALGDVVQALPVLTAVRRALPKSQIAWVVDEAFAPLLEGHPWIDRLIPVPLRRWRRGGEGRARELAHWVGVLRGFRPEIAVDLMGNFKGAVLARLSGAPRRLGAAAAGRREASSALLLTEKVVPGTVHAVERGLELLAPLGLPPAPVDFAPEALDCGRDLVPPGDYVLLHPGAAWANKRYPPAHWGAVAAEVARVSGLPVRVGAARGEESLADAVVAASQACGERLDAPSLAHLAGAIRGARLVLAGDTGAAHLARALAVPVVAVHGPTDPERHGPWAAPEASVFLRLPCSFCHRPMDEAKACLDGLAPALVARRALTILAAQV